MRRKVGFNDRARTLIILRDTNYQGFLREFGRFCDDVVQHYLPNYAEKFPQLTAERIVDVMCERLSRLFSGDMNGSIKSEAGFQMYFCTVVNKTLRAAIGNPLQSSKQIQANKLIDLRDKDPDAYAEHFSILLSEVLELYGEKFKQEFPALGTERIEEIITDSMLHVFSGQMDRSVRANFQTTLTGHVRIQCERESALIISGPVEVPWDRGLKKREHEGQLTPAEEVEVDERARILFEKIAAKLSANEVAVLISNETEKVQAEELGLHRSRIGQLRESSLRKVKDILAQERLPGLGEDFYAARARSYQEFSRL